MWLMVTIDPVRSIGVTVTSFNYTFCVKYRGQMKVESDKMILGGFRGTVSDSESGPRASLQCPFMLYIQTPSVMCCFEMLQTNRVTALWLTLTLAGGQPKHVWHWLCSTESNICPVLFLCWIRQNHKTSNYLLCVNTSSPTDDIWGLLSNMKDSNFNIYHLHLQWKSIGQI